MPGANRIYERPVGEAIRLSQQDAANCGPEIAHFTLHIGNYGHIRRAYGEDAALGALDQLVHRVNRIVQGGGIATAAAHGQIMVGLTSLAPLQAGNAPHAYRTWLWSLCAAMSGLPVEAGSAAVFPLLSADWNRLPGGAPSERSEPTNPWHLDDLAPDAWLNQGEAWAQRYRADMAAATEALAAIAPAEMYRQDRASQLLLLLWQPVRDVRDPDNILYYEALLRFVDRHGVWMAPTASLLALERLGLVNLLDQHVVSRVVAALEGDPDVRLAVNISARSARSDLWWHDVMARLRASPAVARRLTIEITETAALPDMASAVRFVEDMKRLGCKVALDDFGVGFASIRQVMALSPDVVKIDRLFLQRAEVSDREHATFLHLVQLAQSLGANVIVEGVETEAQADLAWQAGARWQQGYHWGRPAASQAWRAIGPSAPSNPGAFDGAVRMDLPAAPVAQGAGR